MFDDREVIHPATLPGMRDRVITVGSASKEYRMIGWRVGWVVGPATIVADVARVSISNVVCQTGIAMGAVATAIESKADGVAESALELQRRRDLLLEELGNYRVIPPHGGWSFLVDLSPLGIDGPTGSQLLLEKGRLPQPPWSTGAASTATTTCDWCIPTSHLIGWQASGHASKRRSAGEPITIRGAPSDDSANTTTDDSASGSRRG